MAFINPDFHFLRPLWFLAIIPALLLFLAIRRARADAGGWDKEIDSSLLPYLLDGESGKQRRWPLVLLLLAWLLASLGLAGPVWEKLPQPVQKKADALVIIQDLSLSFLAKDLSPNRLTRARHKLLDILRNRKEGTTALIVYSGDAHVVTPLTDDTNTIAAMVPDLAPAMMPSFGSNLPAAVTLALRLFRDGAGSGGQILLLTDEVAPEDVDKVVKLLAGKKVVLSVLGVGTEDGGPIPKNDGGFLKDELDNIVIPRLNRTVLQELAEKNGGRYSDLTLADGDFKYLLAAASPLKNEEQYRQIDREADQWQEQGYWLALLLLPLALLAFRRGWLLGLVMLILLPTNDALAMEWRDLWLRPDQQGAQALAANAPQKAAQLFKSPRWQGAAAYKAGNYEAAVAAFDGLKGDDDNYNLGNALARKGQLKEALQAYDRALQLNPQMEDASFNRNLVKKLLEEQEQQQKQGQDQGQPQDSGQPQEGQNRKDRETGPEQEDKQKPGPPDKQEQEMQSQHQQTGAEGEKQGSEPEDQAQRVDAAKDQAQKQAEQKDQQQDREDGSADQPQEIGAEEEKLPGEELPEQGLKTEEQLALEQWLRKIPDNPGGLLKRKFEYQYQQNPNRNPQNNKKIW